MNHLEILMVKYFTTKRVSQREVLLSQYSQISIWVDDIVVVVSELQELKRKFEERFFSKIYVQN